MGDVTRILEAIDKGNPQAAEELLPLVYDELRRLAAQKLSHEKPGQTLQATALVHEAYMRLVGSVNRPWENRGHFFAAAAEAMRRILVENARRKRTLRGGGTRHQVPLDHLQPAVGECSEDMLALDEALQRFEEVDKTKAELVKLRYFAGLTIPQAATALSISVTTANRYWSYARAWLHEELDKDDQDAGR
jgi:RNA polymerase sigma factor (TIGR02999 family)